MGLYSGKGGLLLEGFLRMRFGGLIFGGRLFSEFYGILHFLLHIYPLMIELKLNNLLSALKNELFGSA